MSYTYNPAACRVMSEWVYPFPMPNEKFSWRDKRAFRVSAINDRLRLLNLDPDVLSPALERLQAGIHEGQNLVYEKFIDYASPIQKRIMTAHSVIGQEPPVVPPTMVQDVTDGRDPESLRAAYNARDTQQKHEREVAAAKVDLTASYADLGALIEYANRAFDQWTLLGERLFSLHYEVACGQRHLEVNRRVFVPFRRKGDFAAPSLEIDRAFAAHDHLRLTAPEVTL